MAITTASRTAYNLLVDDSGSGTDGSVWDKADVLDLLNVIDGLIAGNITTGGSFRTGYTADASSYTQANANLVAGNTTEALGVAGGTVLTNLNFYIAGDVQRKATIQIGKGGSGSLGGQMIFYTKSDASSGADVAQAGYIGVAGGGLVWGAPTGADKGAGTINAQAVYDDNVLLTDWVLELAYRGASTLPHAGRLFTLVEVESVAREECRLPWMPKGDDFEAQRHLGGMVTRLVQGQEQQQLYILDLEKRIAALEAQVKDAAP